MRRCLDVHHDEDGWGVFGRVPVESANIRTSQPLRLVDAVCVKIELWQRG
jgi:hypothetical protein